MTTQKKTTSLKTTTTKNKRALGRGLTNLIPQEPIGETASGKNLQEINLEKIRTNPANPRKKFDKTAIEELAATIEAHGLLQPILVEKKENYYVVITGERRLRACRHLKLKTIWAEVKDLSEQEVLEIALIENIQREQLDAIEEAVVFQQLLEKQKITQEELSRRIGKNRTTIANRIRLLQLPVSVQTAVADGRLSEGQVRPLLSFKDTSLQEQLAQEIIQKGFNARQIESLVKDRKESKKKSTANSSKKPSQEIIQMQKKLEEFFSARVQLQHNSKNNNGKISIEYFDLDDLERVLQKIDPSLGKL